MRTPRDTRMQRQPSRPEGQGSVYGGALRGRVPDRRASTPMAATRGRTSSGEFRSRHVVLRRLGFPGRTARLPGQDVGDHRAARRHRRSESWTRPRDGCPSTRSTTSVARRRQQRIDNDVHRAAPGLSRRLGDLHPRGRPPRSHGPLSHPLPAPRWTGAPAADYRRVHRELRDATAKRLRRPPRRRRHPTAAEAATPARAHHELQALGIPAPLVQRAGRLGEARHGPRVAGPLDGRVTHAHPEPCRVMRHSGSPAH